MTRMLSAARCFVARNLRRHLARQNTVRTLDRRTRGGVGQNYARAPRHLWLVSPARTVRVLVERNRHGGLLPAENDVGGILGSLMFGYAVAKRRQVDPG